MKNLLKIGKITGYRGINGEIKIQHFCDNSEVFIKTKKFFSKSNQKLDFYNFKIQKNNILSKIRGINSRTESEIFLRENIYAKKDDIPKDENQYFIEDLKGFEVLNYRTNIIYGILKDVLKSSNCDVYSVFLKEKEFLVPILKGTVKEIDLQNKKILISPIKGIFEDEN